MNALMRLAEADGDDLAWVRRARHSVYADELGQYTATADGELHDSDGLAAVYLVASVDGRRVGFVGLTPPESARFSVERFVPPSELGRDAGLYEIRALTVLREARGSAAAAALMYAAFRWAEARGARRIVAIGRREVVELYTRAGMQASGRSFSCGQVCYELMTGDVPAMRAGLAARAAGLRRLGARLDWQLRMPFLPAAPCFHGGACFEAIGEDFDDLRRRESIISADVLDAWFPPAPPVLDALHQHAPWIARTSPPTHAAGVVRAIAKARGVPREYILAGAGSSALIFLAFRQWLDRSSRVLLPDPTYGEYAHVLEQVIGCTVERFPLERDAGYRMDLPRLRRKLGEGFDLLVWVNPNNPTGLHVTREEMEAVLRDLSPRTKVWIDEAYLEYAAPGESLEPFARGSDRVFVCKSLSKVYALSGMRVAYLCGCPRELEPLRAWTPPWSISLPAQIAAVAALQAPEYYAGRYRETAALRADLETGLRRVGIGDIVPGSANFLLFHLGPQHPRADIVAARCRSRGLYLRELGAMGTALGASALRVAVKDADTNRRTLAILGDALG